MLASFAACDVHLPAYLREMVDENKSQVAKIVRVETPSPTYRCGCNAFSQWYIRVVADPEEKVK